MSYPITWKPAHTDNFTVGRSGTIPGWLVHHRMVGFLNGTDRHFARAGIRVSTHFGIGHRVSGGRVEISQYVELDDTAFGNGNNVDSSGNEVKSEWNRLNFPSQPNRHSISIEHEDGGSLNRGVVTDDIIEASIWLDKLLLSGDPAKLRAAGVRFRSEALVRAYARVLPRDDTHIIDHHFIAGPLKPFCWRRWLDDPGFPQDRYLEALAPSTEPPSMIEQIPPGVKVGTIVVNGPGHSYLRLIDGSLVGVGAGFTKSEAIGPVVLRKGTVLGDTLARRTGYVTGLDAAFFLGVDVTFTPAETDQTHTVTVNVDGQEKASLTI